MGTRGPSHPSKGPAGPLPRARPPRLLANIAPAVSRLPTRSADVYIRAAYACVILMPVSR